MGNEVGRTGENWTQGKGKKGKEAEGNTKATRAGRPVEEPVSNRGKKWRESGREAENAKRGATPLEREYEMWRELERTGENWTQGRGRKESERGGNIASKGP
ncbi:MAG: hypothetical protein QF760_02120 [Candidatus Thalassarchaeaceae archaeon]|nr:hypothetical protein [Candidatus Thalassarchaeaceae archaeon]MDP6703305.1 hypothetical protein [Candidatus Thalassarchaeaceae archaeon]MDP7004076.1 hypothetical protein [Candidatus Thalassarchaeaceae archaeon]